MHRLLLSMSAAVLLGGALTFGGAVPAQAAFGGCTVYASIPEKLSYTSSVMLVKTTVSDPGNCMQYAHYNVVRSDGAKVAGDSWSTPGTHSQSFYAGSDGPGTFVLAGDGGYDADYDDIVTLDSGSLVAKFGSKVAWKKATRKGSKLTVTASATRFASYDYQGWATKVLLQKQSSGSWVTVASKTSNSKGAATLTVKKAKGLYRVVTSDTGTVWGSASGSHTK